MNGHRILKRTGFVFVFAWFAIGGIFHFAATDMEMRIMPPYVPWPRAAVLVSGVLEWAGAVGMLIPGLRRPAGVGLCLLTVAVTPANVYMLQHSDRFQIAPWILETRLVVQALLVALILWSTWSARRLWRAGD